MGVKVQYIPDVDIDVKDRETVASLFADARRASMVHRRRLLPHPTGLYFQKIPVDPVTDLAVFPYDIAEEDLGYEKIDLLPNHVYDRVTSMSHLDELLARPIDWRWFEDAEFVALLFHFGGQIERGTRMAEVVSTYCPKSVLDLAALAAVKLPGKKHLIGQSWEDLHAQIWLKDPEGRPAIQKVARDRLRHGDSD